MRVALFIDGKNFYGGLKDRSPSTRLNFGSLANWLVAQAGGTRLWGAYYYTGIETGPNDGAPGQVKLRAFLDWLEDQPGFFVFRFPRRAREYNCAHCGQANRYTQEKEVDTTIVADMLRLAAVGAFEIAVLVSGDADHAPAVEGVRALGKQVYVATWGGTGLSPRIRKATFDHIDLITGLEEFRDDTPHAPSKADAGNATEPVAAASAVPSPAGVPGAVARDARSPAQTGGTVNAADVFVAELRQAELRFRRDRSGYVGLNYFVTRWESRELDASPDVRRRLVNDLVRAGKVEIYPAPDGSQAIRSK